MMKHEFIYARLAYRNLSRHKITTFFIVALLAIVSSTIYTSGNIFEQIKLTEENISFSQKGEWSNYLFNVNEQQRKEISEDETITIGKIHNLGKIKATQESRDSELGCFGYLDKKSIELSHLELLEGRLPKNKDEIAITADTLVKLGKPIKINQPLHITYENKLGESDETFIVSGIINPYTNAWVKETENNYITVFCSKNYSTMHQFLMDLMLKTEDPQSIQEQFQGLKNHHNDSYLEQALLFNNVIYTCSLILSLMMAFGCFFIDYIRNSEKYITLNQIGISLKQICKIKLMEILYYLMLIVPISIFISMQSMDLFKTIYTKFTHVNFVDNAANRNIFLYMMILFLIIFSASVLPLLFKYHVSHKKEKQNHKTKFRIKNTSFLYIKMVIHHNMVHLKAYAWQTAFYMISLIVILFFSILIFMNVDDLKYLEITQEYDFIVKDNDQRKEGISPQDVNILSTLSDVTEIKKLRYRPVFIQSDYLEENDSNFLTYSKTHLDNGFVIAIDEEDFIKLYGKEIHLEHNEGILFTPECNENSIDQYNTEKNHELQTPVSLTLDGYTMKITEHINGIEFNDFTRDISADPYTIFISTSSYQQMFGSKAPYNFVAVNVDAQISYDSQKYIINILSKNNRVQFYDNLNIRKQQVMNDMRNIVRYSLIIFLTLFLNLIYLIAHAVISSENEKDVNALLKRYISHKKILRLKLTELFIEILLPCFIAFFIAILCLIVYFDQSNIYMGSEVMMYTLIILNSCNIKLILISVFYVVLASSSKLIPFLLLNMKEKES